MDIDLSPEGQTIRWVKRHHDVLRIVTYPQIQ